MKKIRNVLVYLLILITTTKSQESAQYLQNAVRDLRNLNLRQTLRRADATALANRRQDLIQTAAAASAAASNPEPQRRIQSKPSSSVPPLTLTKGELAAIYEAALTKGETIQLDTGDNSYVSAAIHQIDDAQGQGSENHQTVDLGTSASEDAGYYYYYYPLKSFLDEITSQPSENHYYSHSRPATQPVAHGTTPKPHYQYHSHSHTHNVKITPMNTKVEEKQSKPLEPLFMAISGFIGMALMFVLSVVVFPKFGIKKIKKSTDEKTEKFDDFARLALEAIEGGACAERFACELGQSARAFRWQDNRFVKLFRRIAPASFSKQIDRVRRYSSKRIKCTAIPCKPKQKPKPNNNNNNKNMKNVQKFTIVKKKKPGPQPKKS